MAFQAAADIPLLIRSDNATSERRVTPSWTISQLKTRLEPITGIPPQAQKLILHIGSSQDGTAIEAEDEDRVQLASFPLQTHAELHVLDTRPPSARVDFSDVSTVPKYTMPAEEYENRTDSVLVWKKTQKLGRFDPNAPAIEDQKIRALEREIEERGISINARCRLLPETDARRGTVSFIGPVPSIPGLGPWIGITLDEPTGKNDGSVNGERYFTCAPKHGAFVRPERVEIGDFPVLGLDDEDMEEI